MSRERTRSRKPAALALSAALVAATTTAWLAVRESAEERRVAVAALDVQLDDGVPNGGSFRATQGANNVVPGGAAAAYSEDQTYTVCRELA